MSRLMPRRHFADGGGLLPNDPNYTAAINSWLAQGYDQPMAEAFVKASGANRTAPWNQPGTLPRVYPTGPTPPAAPLPSLPTAVPLPGSLPSSVPLTGSGSVGMAPPAGSVSQTTEPAYASAASPATSPAAEAARKRNQPQGLFSNIQQPWLRALLTGGLGGLLGGASTDSTGHGFGIGALGSGTIAALLSLLVKKKQDQTGDDTTKSARGGPIKETTMQASRAPRVRKFQAGGTMGSGAGGASLNRPATPDEIAQFRARQAQMNAPPTQQWAPATFPGGGGVPLTPQQLAASYAGGAGGGAPGGAPGGAGASGGGSPSAGLAALMQQRGAGQGTLTGQDALNAAIARSGMTPAQFQQNILAQGGVPIPGLPQGGGPSPGMPPGGGAGGGLPPGLMAMLGGGGGGVGGPPPGGMGGPGGSPGGPPPGLMGGGPGMPPPSGVPGAPPTMPIAPTGPPPPGMMGAMGGQGLPPWAAGPGAGGPPMTGPNSFMGMFGAPGGVPGAGGGPGMPPAPGGPSLGGFGGAGAGMGPTPYLNTLRAGLSGRSPMRPYRKGGKVADGDTAADSDTIAKKRRPDRQWGDTENNPDNEVRKKGGVIAKAKGGSIKRPKVPKVSIAVLAKKPPASTPSPYDYEGPGGTPVGAAPGPSPSPSQSPAPDMGMKGGGKFIQKAIKHPGALHEDLGVPEDKNIPAKKLAKAAKAPGKLGKRARLAQTLKKLHKSKGGKCEKMAAGGAAKERRGFPNTNPIPKRLAKGGKVRGCGAATKGCTFSGIY